MLRPNFPVVGATGSPKTNPEGLTSKCSVRCRHEHLRCDVFLSFKIRPGKLTQPAPGAAIRISVGHRNPCVTDTHKNNSHHDLPYFHHQHLLWFFFLNTVHHSST